MNKNSHAESCGTSLIPNSIGSACRINLKSILQSRASGIPSTAPGMEYVNVLKRYDDYYYEEMKVF